jgi:hypothetical protein
MLRYAFLLLVLAGLVAQPLRAHELPERVLVRSFAVAQADRLDLMLRVPLEAMRDVDFPLTPEGYLRLAEARDSLEEAAGLWVIDNLRLFQRGTQVAPGKTQIRISLPGDRAFASASAAREHFRELPLAATTQIFWRQAMLDIRLAYPLTAPPDRGDLTLDVALRQLGVETRVELAFIEPSGKEHVLAFDGEARGLALMPSPWHVASGFLRDGFLHILGGIDHLLFLVCLVLPLRRLWPLVKTVTAFTVAHSITLGAAALGWVPSPLWFSSLVEAVIALSIVYLALENILRQEFRQRWLTAFVFGLAHGFGFASALRESLQFAQGQIVLALGSFNLGVELGQILVLALLLPAIIVFYRRVSAERVATIVISTLVAHTAWHWMTERIDSFSGYFF